MTEKILQIIGEALQVPVNIETSQANCYKWDSLQHLYLIASLEDVFDITFAPEDIVSMKSVKDIEKFIKGYLSKP